MNGLPGVGTAIFKLKYFEVAQSNLMHHPNGIKKNQLLILLKKHAIKL